MFWFLTGLVLGGLGVRYFSSKKNIDHASAAYAQTELKYHETMSNYYRKVIESQPRCATPLMKKKE
jgi:hypothetical protein